MNEKFGFAVAIDGPVGVGKSTTARRVAQELGMTYIDTGAMYRAVALYNIEETGDLSDTAALENSLQNINISLQHKDGTQHVYLNGRDVTNKIRTQEISEGASVVGANQKVREKLVAEQKLMAQTGRIVMDGRDIGSHVLPWAQVKIYLDADIETRTRRRIKDLESKGQHADFEKTLEETKIRDHRDKTRLVSPLIQAPGAIRVDTSNMSPDEVVQNIIAEVVSNSSNRTVSRGL